MLVRLPRHVVDVARRIRRLGKDHWIVECRPWQARRPGRPLRPCAPMRMVRCQRRGFRSTWLLTSLPEAEASPAELAMLYHCRWRIETVFREWKHVLGLDDLRSRSPVAILKEMHAFMILSNLVRWTMSDAAAPQGRLPVQLSFDAAVKAFEDAMVPLLVAPPQEHARLYEQLLGELRRAPIRQRPGRSYPRPNDGKDKVRRPGAVQKAHRIRGHA